MVTFSWVPLLPLALMRCLTRHPTPLGVEVCSPQNAYELLTLIPQNVIFLGNGVIMDEISQL